MKNLNDKTSTISVTCPNAYGFEGEAKFLAFQRLQNTSKPFSHFKALKEISSLFPKVFNKRLVYPPNFSHFVCTLNQDNMM